MCELVYAYGWVRADNKYAEIATFASVLLYLLYV